MFYTRLLTSLKTYITDIFYYQNAPIRFAGKFMYSYTFSSFYGNSCVTEVQKQLWSTRDTSRRCWTRVTTTSPSLSSTGLSSQNYYPKNYQNYVPRWCLSACPIVIGSRIKISKVSDKQGTVANLQTGEREREREPSPSLPFIPLPHFYLLFLSSLSLFPLSLSLLSLPSISPSHVKKATIFLTQESQFVYLLGMPNIRSREAIL